MRRIVSVYFALVLALIAFVVFVAGTLAPDVLADVPPSQQVKKTAPAPHRTPAPDVVADVSPSPHVNRTAPAPLRMCG